MNLFLRTSAYLAVALLHGALAPAPSSGAPMGDWYTDLDQAMAVARREGKPVLADVGSENCPACRMLESQTLSHPAIQERLKNFVKVHINGDAAPHIRQMLGVDAYPTVIAMDPNGRAVGRSVGFVPASRFARTLDNALRKVGPALAEARARQEKAREEASRRETEKESGKAPTRELANSGEKAAATEKSEKPETRSRPKQQETGSVSSRTAALYNMETEKKSTERHVVAQAAPQSMQSAVIATTLPATPASDVPQRLLVLDGKEAPAKKTVQETPDKDQSSKRESAVSALATVRKLQSAGSKTQTAKRNASDREDAEEKVTAADIERWMADADKHLKAGRKREARAMYNKVLENDKENRFGRSDLAFIQKAVLTVDADDDALRRQAYALIKEFKARFPNSPREDHYTVMRAILAADLGKTDEAHSLLDNFPERFPNSRFKDLAYQTWKGLPPVKKTVSSSRKTN